MANCWTSNFKCVDTQTKNNHFMMIFVKDLIHNTLLYCEVKQSTREATGDDVKIADACELWLELGSCKELEAHHNEVQKRCDQAKRNQCLS